jgi:hypothetical protein
MKNSGIIAIFVSILLCSQFTQAQKLLAIYPSVRDPTISMNLLTIH